ncbi:MAG: M48 family metalloprotease, partial [Bacteroidota bacterium]
MTVPTTRRLRPSMVVALALLLSACGTTNTNLVTGESQRGAFTWAQEIELGRETDQQITAQFGLYDDAALTAYVRRLGEDVLATSAYTDPNTPAEIRNTPFTFRVLDADLVNAFAVPGGYVYVTRGLMAFLENEAQLAVVLGHEIGHVLGRHSSQRAQRAQLGQFGLIGAAIGSAVLGAGSGVTQGILDYGGTGLQLLQLSYSREAEREADLAGVAYAEFAGYDASEAARFFRTLNRLSDGNAPPTFLSTHPNPEEREQNIMALANSDPRYQGTAVNTGPYLAQIEGIVLGQDPRQGFVEDGVFWHPELRFRLDVPRGWRTQNSPAAFQMAEPNGQAVVQLTLAQGSTAEGAARALASQQGVQVSGSGAVTVGGNRAYRVEGTAPQQNGSLGFSATFVE